MKNIAAILLLFAVLPVSAQLVTYPVVQMVPAYPRDGQPVRMTWSQTVIPSSRFGTPQVGTSPQPWAGWTYGAAHTVVIYQTAFADAGGGESTDNETVYLPPAEAGTYSVFLELTATTEAGPTTFVFPMGDFVVAPACSSDPSASATYSWEKSAYEIDFEDSMNSNVTTGRPELLSIEGNHVTVRQTLTFGGVAPTRPSCLSSKVDLAIAPGTYRLTWIYDEFFAPASLRAAGNGPTLTRELTFDAPVPRRRTSRR